MCSFFTVLGNDSLAPPSHLLGGFLRAPSCKGFAVRQLKGSSSLSHIIFYPEFSRRKLSSYLTFLGAGTRWHPQRPLLGGSPVLSAGGKEDEWPSFPWGTRRSLGLQRVCSTHCLKYPSLQLECGSHPCVLSVPSFPYCRSLSAMH